MSDELLQYRHFASKQLFDKDLTDEQEEEVLAQFAALDPEKKGQIEWSDFLYYESLAVLRKLRSEVKYFTRGKGNYKTAYEHSDFATISNSTPKSLN